MALNNDDQAQMREYLLGKLSDEEQQKIEERLMVEDELLDEFEASKDEVIEDYHAGELTQNERHWLEAHFLASPEGRERYLFALTKDRFYHPAPDPRPRAGWFERVRSSVNVPPWMWATAGSAAIVILIGVVFIPKLISTGRGEVFNGPALVGSLSSRGEGPPVDKIKLPQNAARLKLRLLLPKSSAAAIGYKAELDNKTNTSPVEVEAFDNESVSVTIPRNLLPPGEYLIQLSATDANGTSRTIPREYLFNIIE